MWETFDIQLNVFIVYSFEKVVVIRKRMKREGGRKGTSKQDEEVVRYVIGRASTTRSCQ